MIRIVHYLNQFFGQVGGEDKADIPPFKKDGPVGPGMAFAVQCKDFGEIVGSIVCGDNYIAQNQEQALAEILHLIQSYRPDAFLAGPAFNAGRYGPACGAVCKAVQDALRIPALSGLYPENPGAELFARHVLIAQTAASAVGMKAAVESMTRILRKRVYGVPLGSPAEEGYIPSGVRANRRVGLSGAVRAVDMLLDLLAGNSPLTELPMPHFDDVPPAKAVHNLRTARIALVTEGGLVPKGNPGMLESSRATKFLRYELLGVASLKRDEYQTVHGGYNNAFVNERPERLLPLSILRELAAEGRIGELAEYFYTTTGNGTSFENCRTFGKAIAEALLEDKVQGVILTST